MGEITRKELSQDLNAELDNFMPAEAGDDIAAIKTNVGSNADVVSATGSVHAKLKDTKTAVSTINTNVGSNADIASAAGSVHAKLKDIKASLGGGIKSVQRGIANSISVDFVVADVNVTIAPVNLSKSFVVLNSGYGFAYAGTTTGYRRSMIRVYLSSSTNLVISRDIGSSDDSVSISWQVVEFN